MAQPKALSLDLSLNDRFSPALSGVFKQLGKLESVTRRVGGAFKGFGFLSLGLWGTSRALRGLTAHAEEMQKALNLAGLGGVGQLEGLRLHAKAFAGEYATSAVDFVNASAQIKSSILGVSDRALPELTKKVSLLAKATGITAEQSTAYLATMLDEYHHVARQMGAMPFVDTALAMGAHGQQNFNLTPAQMQSMMRQSKGAGGHYGVSMAEQFVMLGMLNQSMGSAGAGSYEALLKNLHNASEQLGLSFTATNGKLLAMPDILAKIQAKFGDNLSGNLALQTKLNHAFGGGAVAMKYLLANSKQLKAHLAALGKDNGMAMVQAMALAQVSPWDQLMAKLDQLRESLGHSLLPLTTPFFNSLQNMADGLTRVADRFPKIIAKLGQALGYVLLFFAGVKIGGFFKSIFALLPRLSALFTALMRGGARLVLLLPRLGVGLAALCSPLGLLVAGLGATCAAFGYLGFKIWQNFEGIKSRWHDLFRHLNMNELMRFLSALADALGKGIASVMDTVWKGIKNGIILSINALIEQVNKIPGIHIPLIQTQGETPKPIKTSLLTGGALDPSAGNGLKGLTMGNTSKTEDKRVHINTLHLSLEGGMTPEQFLQMAGEMATLQVSGQ